MAREVAALVDMGHHVDVICLRNEHEPRMERHPGMTVWRLPLRHSRGRQGFRYLTEYAAFFAMAAGLVTFLHLRRPYRLVQVNSLPDVLVFASVVPRLLGARVLLDLQECMPEFFATKFRVGQQHPVVRVIARLEQLSIRFADMVITPTAQMRDVFTARGAVPDKIVVVMDGADEQTFRPVDLPPDEIDRESFTIISHGTVEEHYGLDTVIEAVALLRDEIPRLRFEVYGQGSFLDRLRQLVDERGVADLVRFSGGFVPIDELVSAIARADVGIVAMKRDAFRDVTLAGKMFDFIAMGKPVVSSRTRSVEQTFGASCVELFESSDAQDLARALRRLYHDPQRRSRMARQAAQVAAAYQWSRQREVYRGVVDHLLDPLTARRGIGRLPRRDRRGRAGDPGPVSGDLDRTADPTGSAPPPPR